MANTIAAMVEGRKRWLAELKARGEPVPFGRRRGGRNRSREQIDEANREAEGRRAVRDMRIRENRDGKARKQARRQQRVEQAELQHRHDAFQCGESIFGAPNLAGHLEATLDEVLAAAGCGALRGTTLEDFRRLERSFVENLAGSALPADRVEALYRRFVRIEDLLDRGTVADWRRRARLEEAYMQWMARVQTRQMIGHFIERAEARASSRRPDFGAPRSIAPWATRR